MIINFSELCNRERATQVWRVPSRCAPPSKAMDELRDKHRDPVGLNWLPNKLRAIRYTKILGKCVSLIILKFWFKETRTVSRYSLSESFTGRDTHLSQPSPPEAENIHIWWRDELETEMCVLPEWQTWTKMGLRRPRFTSLQHLQFVVC